MDILIISVLIIAGVLLFLVELFVVPGISLAGISAGVCMIYANYYAFTHLGVTGLSITLVISALACIGSLVWFMRSKVLDKLALKKEIDSTIDNSASKTIKVGDKGICTTRLAQIGYAEIKGHVIEVKSAGEFIEEKSPIVVIRITDGIILVEKENKSY
ncbi:MAG: nodulation efficiency protein D (NfeD) [Bacteroidia bacterium]|nr:nodulation efficiency protein D (NfeD) [Bacteroidia bacterium]